MLEKLQQKDKTYFLLGTAHISKKSVQEVKEIIDKIKPDAICVELCATRYKNLKQADRWRELDIIQVIKKKKSGFLLASLLLSSFQKKLGKQLQIQAGAELMEATKIAKEKNIPLHLVDREVNITIQRTWRSLSFWERVKLSSQLFLGLFWTPKIEEQEIEDLKEQDLLTGMIQELAASFPKVKQVLIDERDSYLAAKIFQTEGKKVFAVVGIGHQKGILKALQSFNEKKTTPDLSPLEKIPPKKAGLGTVIQWSIPILILGVFLYGFFRFDSTLSLQLLWNWFLVNSIPSFLGASIAGASWRTRFTAFIVAPFTSVNPAISAGWVAGLVEALINKPKVKDFENLSEDMLSWRQMKKNLISRILLVVVLTNIGSALGTFAGIPLLAFLVR